MAFQCDKEGCGKLFSCKKTLKEHERTHTGERPYICPICQSTFAQYSSMQKHQRVHDKKKPYKCKYEGCQQAFTQISNLIRHERIHTGEKPYVCELCKKKFASGSNLKQHMQVHNNELQRIQFRCFVKPCEKAYLYMSSLKKHIQVSHPEEYDTLVKTNKVDLADCKEIVSGSAIGDLSHLEEEEEEELQMLMNEGELSEEEDPRDIPQESLTQPNISPQPHLGKLPSCQPQIVARTLSQVREMPAISKKAIQQEEEEKGGHLKVQKYISQDTTLRKRPREQSIYSQDASDTRPHGIISRSCQDLQKLPIAAQSPVQDGNNQANKRMKLEAPVIQTPTSMLPAPAIQNINKNFQNKSLPSHLPTKYSAQQHNLGNNQTSQEVPPNPLTSQVGFAQQALGSQPLPLLSSSPAQSAFQSQQQLQSQLQNQQLLTTQQRAQQALNFNSQVLSSPQQLLQSFNSIASLQQQSQFDQAQRMILSSQNGQNGSQPLQLPGLTSLGLLNQQLLPQLSNQQQQSMTSPQPMFQFIMPQQQNQFLPPSQGSNRTQQATQILPLPQSQAMNIVNRQIPAAAQKNNYQIQQPNTFNNNGTPNNQLQQQQQQQPDLLSSLKGLYTELLNESTGATFQKIQQYAVLAAITALAMQLSISNPSQGSSPRSSQLQQVQVNENSNSQATFQPHPFATNGQNPLMANYQAQVQVQQQPYYPEPSAPLQSANELSSASNYQKLFQQHAQQVYTTQLASQFQQPIQANPEVTIDSQALNTIPPMTLEPQPTQPMEEVAKVPVPEASVPSSSSVPVPSSSSENSSATTSQKLYLHKSASLVSKRKDSSQGSCQEQADSQQALRGAGKRLGKPISKQSSFASSSNDASMQEQLETATLNLVNSEMKFEAAPFPQVAKKFQKKASLFSKHALLQKAAIKRDTEMFVSEAAPSHVKEGSGCCGGSASSSSSAPKSSCCKSSPAKQEVIAKPKEHSSCACSSDPLKPKVTTCCKGGKLGDAPPQMNSESAARPVLRIEQEDDAQQSSVILNNAAIQEDVLMMVGRGNMGPPKPKYEAPSVAEGDIQAADEEDDMIQLRGIPLQSRRKIRAAFSKLPCIKTCLTKFEVSNETNSSFLNSTSSTKIGFEKGEDDFVTQSENQISTSDCRHTCDAQKICPEILPASCDDYFNKSCDCTVYCKKTLRYLQQFVKDPLQVAEIEDLCQVVDQHEQVEVVSAEQIPSKSGN